MVAIAGGRDYRDSATFLFVAGQVEDVQNWTVSIRKLSTNMETNSMEMDYFYRLYEGVTRLAPSSDSETLRALELLPELPEQPRVLDVGCGAQSLVLAEQRTGQIVAVRNTSLRWPIMSAAQQVQLKV